MGTTPFTLENHSTAGCNKFLSPTQILPNWIGRAIAVYGSRKCIDTTPFTLENHSYSWRQQILITETYSSKLDTMCNSCHYGSRKCMETTPFTLENHSTAGCNKFSSPRQILPNLIRCLIAVLWLSKIAIWAQLYSP